MSNLGAQLALWFIATDDQNRHGKPLHIINVLDSAKQPFALITHDPWYENKW